MGRGARLRAEATPVARDLAEHSGVQAARSPGRKDKRKWCRGKVGVEHVVEVVFERHMRDLMVRMGVFPTCSYSWFRRAGGSPTWRCYHVTICSECGKVLKHYMTSDECPDYDPSMESK